MTPDGMSNGSAAAGHTMGRSGAGARVLIVEDDPDSAAMLAAVIEALGHEARTAPDGAAALATIGSFRPDVALLDLSLPGITGVELAHQLRTRLAGEPLLIAAITGWGSPRDLEVVRAAGFDHYFVKPVSEVSLATLLGGPPARSTASRRPRGTPGPVRTVLAATAEVAAAGGDEARFAAAIRGLLDAVDDDMRFELVAVAELARFDFELAALRWSNLRRRIG
jgi:two-component system OmpR family response regulator